MPTPNPSAATVEGLAPGWNDGAGNLENACDRRVDLLYLLCRYGPLTVPIAAELLPDLPLPTLLRIGLRLRTAGTDYRSVRVCLKWLVRAGRAVSSRVVNDTEGPLRVYIPQLDHYEVRRLHRSMPRRGMAPVRDVDSPMRLHTLAANRYAAHLFALQRRVTNPPLRCDPTGWEHEPVYRPSKQHRRAERADLGFSFRSGPFDPPERYGQMRQFVELDRGTRTVDEMASKQRLFRGVDHRGDQRSYLVWCFDEWSHYLAGGRLWTRLAALVEQIGAPRTTNAQTADARTLVTWPSAAEQGSAVPFPNLARVLPDVLSHPNVADLLLSRLQVALLPWANEVLLPWVYEGGT